ncbi:B-cell receptor CD22 [Merluccius polli]|uniref:B-cell receptor CD22 n=1 Tax=Merluccius polli TaxID=89951 RepID=A0AA47M6P4_MERPO|nr:B-cell receptor CD22 [Merluccius polli]
MDYAGVCYTSVDENRCYSDSCYGKCTLRIRDLRLSDSAAEYKFQFITNQPDGKYTGDPGVKLSVTDLQVKVSIPDPTHPTLAELECHSMCGLADPYIWTRRGQSVGGGRYYRVDIRSEDIFSCAVEGYEHLPSPPNAPETPSCVREALCLKYRRAVQVTLSCRAVNANPAANYTWFKDNTDDSSRYMNQGQQLVFDGPKHTSVISSPSGGVKEGSSVTLSCSSDANPAANYTWFKEHEDSVIESGQDYTITNITSELGGNYYCQAHNAIGRHNSTFLSINLTDHYFPETSLTTVVAVRIIVVVSLATILLLLFLWMRRTRASRTASGLGEAAETVGESLPVPVYENISALTNSSSPSVQREPIELQDLLCPIRSETAGPVLCGQL